MLSSPAKRRKTSTTTSVQVNGSNTPLNKQSKAVTPTRASYLSPTKASLARSHPHLTQHNQRRSLTEPRGRNLNDDLLNAWNTSKANNRPAQTNAKTATITQEPTKLHETTREKVQTNSTSPRTEPRPPLQHRQPSAGHPATDQDFLQPPIVPKLVRRFEGSTPARQPSPPERFQPRLPPTLVELGLQDAPERPRGLSSSSPRGSKSGSGRHRQRLRGDQSVTSSPLKPKQPRPIVEHVHDRESETDMAEGEPQAQKAAEVVLDAEQPRNELYEKRMTLESLKADLIVFRKSSVALERAINSDEGLPELLIKPGNLDNVKATLNKKMSCNTRFEQLVTSAGEAASYLELFSPADLQLSSTTTTKVVKGQPKVIHHLSVTAPPPWPPHVYSASFDVVTDAETATVENVVWSDTLPGGSQSIAITNELFQWLDHCMKSQLHGCNVGNLLWGMGQYLGKAIQRAQAFLKLSSNYRSPKPAFPERADASDTFQVEDGKPLNLDQALTLTKYLTRSQMIIDLPTSAQATGTRTRRGKKAEPKIMVTWAINLSWNGVATSHCELMPSGIPDSATQSVKDLFEKLCDLQGFEKALDAVYDLMKSQREATPAAAGSGSRQGSEVPAVKTKGKRKRLPGF